MSDESSSQISRRRLLKVGALAAVGGALLAACGGGAASPTTGAKAEATAAPAAKASTPAAAGATPAAAGATPAAKATTAAEKPASAATAVSTAAKPAAKEGQVVLRLHARAGVEDEMFGKLLPNFESENNVKVEQEVFPGAEYLQKLQTLAAGGTLGDVLQLFTNNASYQLFLVAGSLKGIDEYVKSDNLDLSQWYKYSMDACSVDGKLGGLPFKSHPSRVGLFYNADLFQKAGLDVPNLDWTYDQLVETALKLNKPPDVFAFSHPWHDISYYPIMSRMYGGDFYTQDGRSTMIDQEASQTGWVWHYDMMNKHKLTLNPLQTAPTPNDLFVSGKLGMLRANVGTKAGYAKITEFKWGMTLAPKGPTGKRGSLAETDVEAMTTFSKSPDKAWLLLKLLTSKEAGIGLAQQTGNRSSTPGGRPDVYESPEHLNLPYPENVQKNSLLAMNEAEEWRGPENFRGEEVKRLADEQSDLLLLDNAKPDKAFFDNLKNEIQIILDKPRP
jgi:multiple sugar transport system substrate-binding protein